MVIGFVGFGLFDCLFSTFDFVLYWLVGIVLIVLVRLLDDFVFGCKLCVFCCVVLDL